MKKLVHSLVLCGLVSMPAVALAEESPISGNLTLTSDYQFRGFSQTDEDPAIQGGLDYAHSSGLYIGTWASSIGFTDAGSEWNLYGGYAGERGGIGYDVGLLQYYYPGATEGNTLEIYGGVSYAGFGLKASYSATDYFDVADSKGTIYWDAGYEYAFDNGFGINLHYGYTAGQGDLDDYADWKVGVTKSLSGFDFELAYVDTDVKGDPAADSRIIFSVGKSF